MSVRLSEFAPNIKIERELFEFVEEGRLDQAVLDLVLPNERPREYETVLWDYKRKLPNTSGKYIEGGDEPNEEEVCQIIKDVVSFYNSYGGYIVGGIDEFKDSPLRGCENSRRFAFRIDKLNERLESYTRAKIQCRFEKFNLGPNADTCVGLLYVPRRSSSLPVARFVKGSPEKTGKQIFKNPIIPLTHV